MPGPGRVASRSGSTGGGREMSLNGQRAGESRYFSGSNFSATEFMQ